LLLRLPHVRLSAFASTSYHHSNCYTCNSFIVLMVSLMLSLHSELRALKSRSTRIRTHHEDCLRIPSLIGSFSRCAMLHSRAFEEHPLRCLHTLQSNSVCRISYRLSTMRGRISHYRFASTTRNMTFLKALFALSLLKAVIGGSLADVKHVVMIMFENRSFDHVSHLRLLLSS